MRRRCVDGALSPLRTTIGRAVQCDPLDPSTKHDQEGAEGAGGATCHILPAPRKASTHARLLRVATSILTLCRRQLLVICWVLVHLAPPQGSYSSAIPIGCLLSVYLALLSPRLSQGNERLTFALPERSDHLVEGPILDWVNRRMSSVDQPRVAMAGRRSHPWSAEGSMIISRSRIRKAQSEENGDG
jgi:hypothetical protein